MLILKSLPEGGGGATPGGWRWSNSRRVEVEQLPGGGGGATPWGGGGGGVQLTPHVCG